MFHHKLHVSPVPANRKAEPWAYISFSFSCAEVEHSMMPPVTQSCCSMQIEGRLVTWNRSFQYFVTVTEGWSVTILYPLREVAIVRSSLSSICGAFSNLLNDTGRQQPSCSTWHPQQHDWPSFCYCSRGPMSHSSLSGSKFGRNITYRLCRFQKSPTCTGTSANALPFWVTCDFLVDPREDPVLWLVDCRAIYIMKGMYLASFGYGDHFHIIIWGKRWGNRWIDSPFPLLWALVSGFYNPGSLLLCRHRSCRGIVVWFLSCIPHFHIFFGLCTWCMAIDLLRPGAVSWCNVDIYSLEPWREKVSSPFCSISCRCQLR